MTSRRALILGVSGQDGALLARLLLSKGYDVHGSSRDCDAARKGNLKTLGIDGQVHLHRLVSDGSGFLPLLEASDPHEVYALSGQSSVAKAFAQPLETFDSVATSMMKLLCAIKEHDRPLRLLHAGSGDCFGETAEGAPPASEESAFRPRSPYAIAKASACIAVQSFREVDGLHASNAFLFNHESPLRPEQFVTRKVVKTAVRIAKGEPVRLELGNISVVRDWGWAEEYVDAMWRMLQQETPADFVIATGASHRLEDFVAGVFSALNLDWRLHTDLKPDLFRKADIRNSRADPRSAEERLGWKANVHLSQLIAKLLEAEMTPPRQE